VLVAALVLVVTPVAIFLNRPTADPLRIQRSGERVTAPTPSAVRGPADDRVAKAAAYVRYLAAGEYERAYALLKPQVSYEAFVVGVEGANRELAERLARQNARLVTKRVESVRPVTVAPEYVIVEIRSRVRATRDGEAYETALSQELYFRFDKQGAIDLIYDIGRG
jgi:hypothetical protein